jgi:phenylacetate-CoA ligase
MLLRIAWFGLNAFTFQWKSPQQIKKFQEKKLRFILNYAYKNSLFYKNAFKACGVHPDDIYTLNDLKKLPLVTKKDLRTHFLDFVVKGFSEKTCMVETTSGSTGEHIKILHDLQTADYYGVILMRGHLAIGLKPHHKTVYIRYKRLPSNILQKFGLFKFYHMHSDVPTNTIADTIKKVNPATINCYPTILHALTNYLSDKEAQQLSLHHIVTWSEQLTLKVREMAEEKFGCPVYDQYGAYEAHSLAFECVKKRMHINADSLIMEFVKDGEPVAPGESGDILITSLWNQAMPFIRYKVGDRGVPSDEVCACGRGLPLIENLEGRIEDSLVTPSGEIIIPSRVITLFYPYNEIDTFQILQKKRDAITIKVVKGVNYSEKINDELLQNFRAIFGEETTITIKEVPAIEKTAGGKTRLIICDVHT